MSLSKPMETLNEQMNTLVESQAQEIKALKQYALNVHNFAYGTEWDDEDIVSAMDFDGIIKKMKQDEKRLKIDSDEYVKVKELYFEAKEDNENLKEANEELTEERDCLDETKENYEDAIQAVVDIFGFNDEDACDYGRVAIEKVVKIKGDFVRLKKENEELKEDCDKYKCVAIGVKKWGEELKEEIKNIVFCDKCGMSDYNHNDYHHCECNED